MAHWLKKHEKKNRTMIQSKRILWENWAFSFDFLPVVLTCTSEHVVTSTGGQAFLVPHAQQDVSRLSLC